MEPVPASSFMAFSGEEQALTGPLEALMRSSPKPSPSNGLRPRFSAEDTKDASLLKEALDLGE